MGTALGLATLEGHLWEAANIVRGPVDAADFKAYIFPLLFFKRICDVYDEEIAVALEQSGGDQQFAHFPENHRFQVPEGCHWNDVRGKTSNVGRALQHAFREIEKANPNTLYGIFGDTQWSNKERLSDALLRDLLEHFSRLPLSNTATQSDILGDAYEYLIKKFADLTNKKAGEFYTPRTIVRLMTRILDPCEGETIYDPACGTGGMLLEAVHHVREAGGNVRMLLGKLYGQEKNLTTSSIARINLFLHGVEDFTVVRGDTLRTPAFFEVDRLATFDCVIANPPFSLERWGEEVWTSDPYGRNFAGLPPSKSGDYAWVQHMICSMAQKSGRMAVVLPHGALFRMAAEGKIRRKILGMDLLEAVIGLGPNLFCVGGYEGLIAAQECLPNNDKRDAFAADYSALSRLWEALSPDPCLGAFEADYKWLTQVYESVKPSSGNGKLLWHTLGAKTMQLVHENVHVEALRDDLDKLVMDADVLQELVASKDPKKAKEIEIQISARLRRHKGDPKFIALGERLEKLRERQEQGLLTSIEFLKALLDLAHDVVEAEKKVDPVEEQNKAKAALTELFKDAKTENTPVMVERVVNDIDEIVRQVRFPGWQQTSAGEREVQKALRKTLLKYQLHREQELFDKAYSYIKQYY